MFKRVFDGMYRAILNAFASGALSLSEQNAIAPPISRTRFYIGYSPKRGGVKRRKNMLTVSRRVKIKHRKI